MGRGIPIGNPVVGRGCWRRFLRIRPLAGEPGVAPASQIWFPFSSGFPKLLSSAGKLVVRCLVVGLATPAAAETSPSSQGLLTSGPEPANLIVMGLALAVLFLFRRFRKFS